MQAAQAPRASGVVPWVDRPAPPYTAPAPRTIPYRTRAPACRAGQLQATGGRVGAATGHILQVLRFTNRGHATCLLAGFPGITAVDPRGVRLALHPTRRPGGTFFRQLLPAAMAPGRSVDLDLAGEDVTCLPRRRVYRDLHFTLPAGGTLRSHARLFRVCGGWQMSRFGLPERTTATMPPRPGSVGSLRVSLDAPRAARAGTALRFLITLTNPGRVAVPLRPCPSYTEAIYANATPAGRRTQSLLLNCDRLHAISPGARVRFAMRLPLPPVAAELAKLAWHLNVPAEPATAAPLTLRPPA
jgi:hypothetical protein